MNPITHILLSYVINYLQHGLITNDQAIHIVRMFYNGSWG